MTANASLSLPVSATKRSIIFVALLGNILEYYDFTLYASFSVALSQMFIPQHSPTVKALMILAIYATGFFMRPLGGLVFGYIGDRQGRKKALVLSLLGMAIGTSCIGMLPSTAQIGLAAPLLLMLFRLIQGLCIGGEGAGAAIFCLEHLSNFKPGLVGSLVVASNIFGALLAIVVGILINYLFPGSEWGWRFAFIFGGIIGFVGMYLRAKVTDTPAFLSLNKNTRVTRSPLKEVFKSYKIESLNLLFLGGIAIGLSCMILSYLELFLISHYGLPENSALGYMAFGALCYVVFLPVFGLLADYFSFQKMLLLGVLLTLSFSYPIYKLLGSSQTFSGMAVACIAIMTASVYAPAYLFMMSLFPPQYRYSGIAFNFNLGAALFGGTAPMIATLLVQKTGISAMPGMYFMFLSFCFLVSYYLLQKKSKIRSGKTM